MPPSISGVAVSNGIKSGYIYDTCNGNTTPIMGIINYSVGIPYFVPSFPSALWTPGIYIYTTNADIVQYYGTQICYDSAPWTTKPWQQGIQYVTFPNVSVDIGQQVVISFFPSQSTNGVISGLQMISTSHTPVSFPVGSIAYYPFNGNANDESGNGFDLQVNGATLTDDRFGNPNSSYYFNGVSSFMTNNDPLGRLNFDATSESFTVALWVNMPDLSHRSEFIIDRGLAKCGGIAHAPSSHALV